MGRKKMICFDLVPTEICNWNCNYCAFPLIDFPDRTNPYIIDRHYFYIKEIINKLKLGGVEVEVYLQGGEVGELPKKILRYLLNKFDMKITISTNGLFMKKDYHNDPEIRRYIKQIFWHVSPDCYLREIKDFKDDEIQIVRGIVNSDLVALSNFISYNQNNLIIEYSEIENPIDQKSIVEESIIISCRHYHNEITIDLVNENLCLCIRNFKNITIPLNKANLIRLLTSFPKNVFNLPSIKDSACYSCCRLCVNRTEKDRVSNKLKIRKVL